LSRYFITVNLDKKPYYPVNLTINPPLNLADYHVGSLAVSPTYGGKTLLYADGANKGQEAQTIVFSAGETGKTVSLKGTFEVNDPTQKKEFDYAYTVNYATNTAAYTVKGAKKDDNNLALVNAPSLGVVQGKLDGALIMWDLISQAVLKVKYNDINQQYVLTKTNPFIDLILTIGEEVTPSVQYQLELNWVSGGTSISYPLISTDWATADISQGNATLQMPWAASKEFRFVSTGVAGGSDTMVILNCTYKMTFKESIVRKIKKSLILNAENSGTATWTVPTTAQEGAVPGSVSWEATIIPKTGDTTKKSGTDVTQSPIMIQ
jgi:hypothetical protein